MNSPYMKRFKVTQTYQKNKHDGLDLVGIDSKEIHSTINGIVVYAGWENKKNKKQGFGQYIKIRKTNTNEYYYFGHLAKMYVSTGQKVKITDKIGLEGNTGNSKGSHCHYCMRLGGVKSQTQNISNISKIPNKIGIYNDGYQPVAYYPKVTVKTTSLVDALKSISVSSSFINRKKIANKNGITHYIGTSKQNLQLLDLLKKGQLKK